MWTIRFIFSLNLTILPIEILHINESHKMFLSTKKTTTYSYTHSYLHLATLEVTWRLANITYIDTNARLSQSHLLGRHIFYRCRSKRFDSIVYNLCFRSCTPETTLHLSCSAEKNSKFINIPQFHSIICYKISKDVDWCSDKSATRSRRPHNHMWNHYRRSLSR